MRVLGMISGTSHDGIDAAVVDFVEHDGALTGTVLHDVSTPYSPELRARIVAALPPAQTTLAEVCELDTLIGQAFADAAAAASDAVGGVDAVTSHGQTVYHWVDGSHALGTLQIGQPAWIAERLGVPVVSDVRIRDITAGGHGAPLVSFLDELLLRDRGDVSAALNLGGISNMTVINSGDLVAYDIGPANALIDAVVVDEQLNSLGFDEDGAIAASGLVDPELLEQLLADPYYGLGTPKSTGKEHFHLGYIRAAEKQLGRSLRAADLIATLTELTVRTVARDVSKQGITYLAVSGGGCRNPVMLEGLRGALASTEIVLADVLGAPADGKEAIAFALIGWCTLHGVPATVPGGTGARAPRILGTITPGRDGLVLPAPQEGPIRSLTLTVVR
ncbi:anhydro-N-acetylmuramic acid kinase [Salinibacterium sp. M195]|uniref:anhydro-N-acetylmuramic acid kinase n=1 Tax=Salinibacterium sp. M195 TaxID=2583374 RepID=UPI001C62E193|nr:anhydro-N-acetylmuramic acid kinase [Salinibacterium sp. M195]QYH36573.1 anhydro-N-acetylmuramic acid kinase [Salinibacterium sp. M195]